MTVWKAQIEQDDIQRILEGEVLSPSRIVLTLRLKNPDAHLTIQPPF
ncbi:MAG: hypothetical protein HY537_04510 [Deltaproteobacteria bacterium]|nr:hypothetical protein [Deltaproteobacteria bacterium]